MSDTEESLRAGFAAQGKNMFYTLSSAEQREFLQVVQNRVDLEKKCRGYEIHDNECPYDGGLLCNFCESLDRERLDRTIQELNNERIPSNLKLVF